MSSSHDRRTAVWPAFSEHDLADGSEQRENRLKYHIIIYSNMSSGVFHTYLDVFHVFKEV